MLEILVIKHDVREPDVSGGNMQTVNPTVLLRVPAELVVVPVLLYPQVGRHHLLPQVLKQHLSQTGEGERDNNKTKMLQRASKCLKIFQRQGRTDRVI